MQAIKEASKLQLKKLFQTFKKGDPELCCPSSNRISLVCNNPVCDKALRCLDNHCSFCSNHTHPHCISIPLENITKLINQRAIDCQELMEKVSKVEEQMIDEMRKSRKQLAQELLLSSFSERDLRVIEKIFEKKSYETISGRQTNELCTQLQRRGDDIKNQTRNMGDYGDYHKKILRQHTDIRRKLFLSENIYIDSEVLRQKGSISKDVSFILKALKQPKSLKLLFRASEHGFSANAFHKACNNVEDTLTLVRTQHGKTVGGYTHYKWNQALNGQYFHDKQRKAFLLQLDHYHKLVPCMDTNLIYCHGGYGPTFGSGHNMYISDSCNVNRSSNSKFPGCYQSQSGYRYVECQESYEMFSGAEYGSNYKVVEYEVYAVKW